MASFNKVILAGNMTRDPQMAYTASNTPVCKFGLAVNRKWRDKNSGENREEVCYVDCTAFGRSGEVINQYMGKGRPILIEGRLSYSQWEGQDGSKRSKLEVVVENFQFLGGAQGDSAAGRRQTVPSREFAGSPDAGHAPSGPNDGFDGGLDDVPF